MTITELDRVNDILRIINNSKLSKTKPVKESFATVLANTIAKDPVVQSAATKITVKPDSSKSNDTCMFCNKPGKYFIDGIWRCEEHKDTVLSDALCKDVRIKEKISNGLC